MIARLRQHLAAVVAALASVGDAPVSIKSWAEYLGEPAYEFLTTGEKLFGHFPEPCMVPDC